MAEQRVIGQRIGARPPASPAPTIERPADPPPSGREGRRTGPRRLVVVLVVLVVVLGAGAAWYLLVGRSPGTAAPKPEPTPVAGQVLTVDAVSVNLAGGHYLRLGLAIQLSTEVKEVPDPSRALDLAITLYSGRSVDEVSAAATRDQLKAQLVQQLRQAYGTGVMDVYLTDYVTQ